MGVGSAVLTCPSSARNLLLQFGNSCLEVCVNDTPHRRKEIAVLHQQLEAVRVDFLQLAEVVLQNGQLVVDGFAQAVELQAFWVWLLEFLPELNVLLAALENRPAESAEALMEVVEALQVY